MSKFFEALENAEREREARGLGVVPDEAPPAPATETTTTTVVAAPAPAPQRPRPLSPGYGAPIRSEPLAPRVADRTVDTQVVPTGELDEHLVSILQPTSIAAEQYRAARLYIETLRRERGISVIAVSSARPGDGKTVTALNLAGTLAQGTDSRVALIEIDMRRPTVAQNLGISNARGLSTYLLGESIDVDSLLERRPGLGFTVLLAGPPVTMPYELLKSPRLRDLFATLRTRFDHVIVDTPPMLPFPDVGILRDLVDGFLIVVRAQRTPREPVQEALAALGPNLTLGVIFNDFIDEARLAATAGYYGSSRARSR
ncbi:MAG: CpsD/CapB family tyrosine-protein kinase [Candidatus Rokubacteria bacterium]|nr:CpsD/CapB family tyrosine-protein kinase [Candidatus Rokubacteria bacterium]